MTTETINHPGAGTRPESPADYTPSRSLELLVEAVGAYRRLFAAGKAAPLLSRPRPVRRTGFDMDLVVEDVRVEAEDVVSLTLTAPDGSDLPGWVPGAHLDVFLPSGRQRQYSLCGDPADRGRYRIAVRRIADGGGGSVEVHEALTAGDTVHVRGPRNAFPLVQAESYLFVAGGIGITPILPMVKAAAEGADARWHMVYLGRSRTSMPFLDELAECTGGEVEIRPDDEYGVVDVAGLLGRAEPGATVYLCGPPPLLNAAHALMPEINPAGALHTERFSAPPVQGGEPFEVTLARSGVTVSVAADETALTAIRREVPGVAYSCQQGFCGSCKIGVLAGKVDHRDRSLLEAEREDSMLICVSRSEDGPLVLDL